MKRRFYIQAEIVLDDIVWFNTYGAPLNEEELKFWVLTHLASHLASDVRVSYCMEGPRP